MFKHLKSLIKLVRLYNLAVIGASQALTYLYLLPQTTLSWANTISLCILSVSTLMLAAAGYIINDYYDIKVDLINRPDAVVVGKQVSRREAIMWHFIFTSVGLAIAAILSLKMGTLVLGLNVLLWYYSNSLKRKPIAGNAIIAFLSGMSIWIVGFLFDDYSLELYVYAIFACFVAFLRQIIKDITDLKGDLHFGAKTLPIALGIRKTKIIIFTLTSCFYAVTLYLLTKLNNDWLFLFFGVMLVPIVLFSYKLYWADTNSAYMRLRAYSKWILVAGLLSMILV